MTIYEHLKRLASSDQRLSSCLLAVDSARFLCDLPTDGMDMQTVDRINSLRSAIDTLDVDSVPDTMTDRQWSDAMLAAWGQWVQHRKEIGKPLRPTTMRMQMSALDEMGEARAIATINHSISNGWTGLFEPKGMAGGRTAGTFNDRKGGDYASAYH